MSKNQIITALIALACFVTFASEMQAQSIVGTWELAQVGDQPLPAVLETENECREEIVAATLTVGTDNTWKLESTERDVCGTDVDEERDSDEGRFNIVGSNIEMLDSRGESQKDQSGDDLDDFSTGTIAGDTLTFKLGKTDTTVTFRKKQ